MELAKNRSATCELVRCDNNRPYRKIDRHHITYEPERAIYLCRKHHIEATAVNLEFAVGGNAPNWLRCALYILWRDGDLQASQKAIAHSQSWFYSGTRNYHGPRRSLRDLGLEPSALGLSEFVPYRKPCIVCGQHYTGQTVCCYCKWRLKSLLERKTA